MAVKRFREVIEQEEGGDDNCLMLLCKVGEAAERESESAIIGRGERVFECKTCKKKFYSFQALGGHRASHKKLRLMAADLHQALPEKPKKHACSICGLEFPLGQALGGHMRRHRPAMSPPTTNGIDKSEAVAVAEKAVPVPILMRSNSSKRIFGFDGGLDLNLTPDENDLKRRNIPPLFDFLHLIA